MRTQFSKLIFAAAFGLALAFTFSCSSDSGGGNPPNINSGIEISSSSSKLSSSSSLVPSSSSVALSSSSSMPSSSSVASSSSSAAVSSSSVEYVGGSCNASDYGRVEIGGQVWMAKNWGCYAAGSKCYNNDPANCNKYGRLYYWATAMKLSDNCYTSTCSSQITTKHQGICPSGWHIPSDADWNVLVKFVNPSCSDNTTCAGAGTKLKARESWNSYSGVPSGTDDFGFAALPGGGGTSGSYFDGVGNGGYWWSASENNANFAYYRRMGNYGEDVDRYGSYKGYSLSVRCVEDED